MEPPSGGSFLPKAEKTYSRFFPDPVGGYLPVENIDPRPDPIGALPTKESLAELRRLASEAQPSLRSYTPRNKDRIAYWLAEQMGGDGRKNVRFAKKLTDAGQNVVDWGTLPLYFTPAAPIAAAFDISRGIVERDPYELALGMLGVARPLKSVAPTMSDAAERALVAATGTGGISVVLQNFLMSLSNKKEGN